jgi:DNA-binding CsgD family transcriptional regulator
VLVDVPSRLVVFGTEAALLTERWGAPGGSRVVVRQPGIVLALRELAGALWDRAVTPPGLGPCTPGVDGARRGALPLLALMAGGAVDEQIARALGVSVRTVRRRIATLLVELGADSRFQAGAEAVRRGWI